MDITELMDLMGTSSQTYDPSETAQTVGKDDFMRLLITELKNQDPLEPVANTDFVTQLAQFSSLEQTENMSDSLEALATLQQETFRLQSLSGASALIGKEVVFYEGWTDTTHSGVVEAVEVDRGSITLKIEGHNVPLSQVMEVREPASE
jgi:flagellar basal-body rod modification protein FlgD